MGLKKDYFGSSWSQFLAKFLCLSVVLCASAFAEEGTFLPFRFKHNKLDYNYTVYLPPNYTAEHSWPVILFLHGKRESGSDGVKHTRVGLGNALRKFPERYPAIVVFPQARKHHHWKKDSEEAALQMTRIAMQTFNGDPTRLFVTGLSLGGFATWRLAAAHPGMFAAAMPMSSAPKPEMAPALVGLAIWAFHCSTDILVPAFRDRQMVRAVQALGGKQIRYRQYRKIGHNCWDAAFSDKELPEWLFTQQNFQPEALP